MKNPRIIHSPLHVADVPIAEVRPGMVLAEGIVFAVTTGPSGYFLHVPFGTVQADPGETVQVYAVLGGALAEAYVEGMLARTSERLGA